MAFSRWFADSDRVVEAIFKDDFGLSDEEESESNDEMTSMITSDIQLLVVPKL